MDRQLVAVLHRARDFVDVGEVEPRMDALRVEIERERHEVDVAGALAIAEQTALDAVGAGHQPELRCRHAGAAIVMRMQARAPRCRAG